MTLRTQCGLLLLPFLFTACAQKNTSAEALPTPGVMDSYTWLEDVEGHQAMEFVKAQNAKTLSTLKHDPHYPILEKDLRKVALAEDRVPTIHMMFNNQLYNFWQDEQHVHGIWRRTTLKSYKTVQPQWETLLDLDALSAQEHENWVWRGAVCLAPEYRHCMVRFSRAGKDATVDREFDLQAKDFVKDGFQIAEAKSEISWRDENTLYVATDFGAGSLTESQYPREVHLWKRGQPLDQSTKTFEAGPKDVSAFTEVYHHADHTALFHFRNLSGTLTQVWYEDMAGHRTEILMPHDAEFAGLFHNLVLFQLRTELATSEQIYKAGTLVGVPLEKLPFGEKALLGMDVLFTPTAQKFLTDVTPLKDEVLVSVLDKVQGKVLRLQPGKNQHWKSHEISFGKTGMTAIGAVDREQDRFFVNFSDFLTPPTVYWIGSAAPEVVKQSPNRFKSQNLVSEQWLTHSPDGTAIYYFIVHKKDWKKNSQNPTLLFGYGGFEIPMVPNYLETVGKAWLEKGGVYVLATIRGGGEFGPEWHESVARENRQKSFDDFTSVAQDLIRRKVTSPAHLGIQGRSNGGLLVGASFVQHPELYNAVLCQVPLLDMLRYNKLLVGASWEGEYGNPDEPAMRQALLKYSPFQNLKPGTHYPEVMFMTSSKDDRVHPYHARKMMARMQELGMPALYFENTEGGGHAGSANLQQRVLWNTLEYTYLWKKLGPTEDTSRRLANTSDSND